MLNPYCGIPLSLLRKARGAPVYAGHGRACRALTHAPSSLCRATSKPHCPRAPLTRCSRKSSHALSSASGCGGGGLVVEGVVGRDEVCVCDLVGHGQTEPVRLGEAED